MNELAIDIRSLSKTYVQSIKSPGLWGAVKGLVWQQKKEVLAVKDLSFQVRRGEAVGLIG